MKNNIKYHELIAVFLAALSSLLFEITLTKIFSYSVWANYAYLVISTAMFGLGFSGILLTRFPRLSKLSASPFLCSMSILTGVFMVFAFIVMNHVPIHLPDAPLGWGKEILNIAIVFLALALPYVFFGLMIAYILNQRAKHANTYYFADLIGAGLGSFLLVPLIPVWEPQGLVLVCGLLCIISGLLFAFSAERRGIIMSTLLSIGLVALSISLVTLPPLAARWVDINVHVKKRNYSKEKEIGQLEKHGWSALSRVDVASFAHPRYFHVKKRVWIDGGANESSIVKFDGDYEKLRSKREEKINHAKDIVYYMALPHLLKNNHSVCVIGTSGGEDSWSALGYGARKVVGVEMDPQIVKFVTEDYREWAGGLFTDGDYSEIVVDEGRSYLKRSNRKFDVIQQVNNFTPIALQNGALNLSESYLLTVESFQDFYDSLTDDGILAISRWGAVRLVSLAVEMFKRQGLEPEEYSKHIIVCKSGVAHLTTLLMKKSPFTREEVDIIFEFHETGPLKGHRRVAYAPYRTNELPTPEKNVYYQLATSKNPSEFYFPGCFDLSPPTDNRPFFNRFQRLGIRDRNRSGIPFLTEEFASDHIIKKSKIFARIPPGDLPPFIILLEAIILSSVFFGFPLFSKKELREKLKSGKKMMGYFACLGVGFIFIEICLIQRLVLFLGAPVYSISAVLGSLLISAGIGSLIAQRFRATSTTLRLVLLAVSLSVLLLHFAIPLVTELFLGQTFTIRLIIAIILLCISGVIMGMPLPLGIRYLNNLSLDVIPWAWAMNGYFTVIGSALSVILAVQFGFAMVFFIAAGIYALATLFVLSPNSSV